MAPRDDDQHVKGGPANHAARTDLDAPTPPGGPLRQGEPGPDPDDAFLGKPPAGDANPGDYMSNDQQGGVSDDTGTPHRDEP